MNLTDRSVYVPISIQATRAKIDNLVAHAAKTITALM